MSQPASEDIAFDTMKQMLASVPQLAESVIFVVDEKVNSIKADQLRLEKELAALQAKPRQPFQVNPNFKREHLTGEELKLYDQSWAWMKASANALVNKILANRYWSYQREGVVGPYPAKAIHLYHLRNFQQLTHSCMVLLKRYGDPLALAEIERIWRGALSMMVTNYGNLKVGTREKAREKAGVFKRWLYYNNEEMEGSSWTNSDEALLENGLVGGTLAEVNYILKLNKSALADEFEDVFLNHFMKRRLYLNIQIYGGDARRKLWDSAGMDKLKYRQCLDKLNEANLAIDLDKWGHQLRHPYTSTFCCHYFSYITYGWAEDKKAYEKVGKNLDADREVIATDYGNLLLQPHGNSGKCKELGWGFHDTCQDITYNRESHPHELMACWAGSPFHTREQLAALARTMHYAALTYGPKAKGVASTLGGHIAGKNRNSERFIALRNSKTYKGRYKNGGTKLGVAEVKPKGDLELMQQVQRGHSFILSHLDGSEAIKQDLMQLTDAASSGNQAGRLALLLFQPDLNPSIA